MRRLFYVIGCWAIANVALTIYWFKLWETLYFEAVVVRYGVPMIGAILGIASLFFVFKEKSKIPPILALILVVALSVFFIHDASTQWGVTARFYIEKPGYESTAAKLFSAPNETERKIICEGICEVDIGADGIPEQVVFPWTRDDVMLGWVGIVYDASGSIIKAPKLGDKISWESFNGKKSFFGCSVLRVQHLTGNWYFCHFWHR
jgi:hypothetical protein